MQRKQTEKTLNLNRHNSQTGRECANVHTTVHNYCLAPHIWPSGWPCMCYKCFYCIVLHAMQHRTVSIYLRSYPTIRKRLQKAHLRLSTVLIQSCQAREVLGRNALSIHFSNVCIGVCRVANYNHLQVNHYHAITGRLQPYNYYVLCFIFNCPTKQWWVAR